MMAKMPLSYRQAAKGDVKCQPGTVAYGDAPSSSERAQENSFRTRWWPNQKNGADLLLEREDLVSVE